jgi:hypothetical protein
VHAKAVTPLLGDPRLGKIHLANLYIFLMTFGLIAWAQDPLFIVYRIGLVLAAILAAHSSFLFYIRVFQLAPAKAL